MEKNAITTFFGIGAFDSSAVRSGKSYAEKEQWTSPDKAIIGGAKFIRNEYFENNQLNLYQSDGIQKILRNINMQ